MLSFGLSWLRYNLIWIIEHIYEVQEANKKRAFKLCVVPCRHHSSCSNSEHAALWVIMFWREHYGDTSREYSAYVFPKAIFSLNLYLVFFLDSVYTDIFVILQLILLPIFISKFQEKTWGPGLVWDNEYFLKETERIHCFNLQMVPWVERTQECQFPAPKIILMGLKVSG